jgi:hypothetical protein
VELDEHRIERMLDHPRVPARGAGADLGSFDEDDSTTGRGQVRRHRRADDPATDHDDVRRPTPFHGPMMPARHGARCVRGVWLSLQLPHLCTILHR